MTALNIKQQAYDLVNQLPDDATWDDLVYQVVLRREIEKGIEDSDAGRVSPVEDVIKEFGITE